MGSRLPFETGLLSTMSQDELYDLANELERIDFWRQERDIEKLVHIYIRGFWSQPNAPGPSFMRAPWRLGSYVEEPSVGVTATYRDVHVEVPRGISEDAARLLAGIQIREQVNPGYDPTED